jgi:hypothetical protein
LVSLTKFRTCLIKNGSN